VASFQMDAVVRNLEDSKEPVGRVGKVLSTVGWEDKHFITMQWEVLVGELERMAWVEGQVGVVVIQEGQVVITIVIPVGEGEVHTILVLINRMFVVLMIKDMDTCPFKIYDLLLPHFIP